MQIAAGFVVLIAWRCLTVNSISTSLPPCVCVANSSDPAVVADAVHGAGTGSATQDTGVSKSVAADPQPSAGTAHHMFLECGVLGVHYAIALITLEWRS